VERKFDFGLGIRLVQYRKAIPLRQSPQLGHKFDDARIFAYLQVSEREGALLSMNRQALPEENSIHSDSDFQ